MTSSVIHFIEETGKQYRPYIDLHRIQINDAKKRSAKDQRALVKGVPSIHLGVLDFERKCDTSLDTTSSSPNGVQMAIETIATGTVEKIEDFETTSDLRLPSPICETPSDIHSTASDASVLQWGILSPNSNLADEHFQLPWPSSYPHALGSEDVTFTCIDQDDYLTGPSSDANVFTDLQIPCDPRLSMSSCMCSPISGISSSTSNLDISRSFSDSWSPQSESGSSDYSFSGFEVETSAQPRHPELVNWPTSAPIIFNDGAFLDGYQQFDAGSHNEVKQPSEPYPYSDEAIVLWKDVVGPI